jgi:hypothetical protein
MKDGFGRKRRKFTYRKAVIKEMQKEEGKTQLIVFQNRGRRALSCE